MANLFDKTYDKLLSLKEDFDTEAEIERFFDDFLILYIQEMTKALPNTTIKILQVPNGILTVNEANGKTVSARATISILTTDFNIPYDFDFDNPVHHKGWDEYPYKQIKAQTTLDLIDYLVDFEKHGVLLGNYDERFPSIMVKSTAVEFTKLPYVYRYLNNYASASARLSKFGQELEMKIDLILLYSGNAAAANDVTSIINKYFKKIYEEVNTQEFAPGSSFTPTQVKLIKALDGLDWEADMSKYDIKNLKGTGYTEVLEKIIKILYKNEGFFPFSRFIITGGDF